MANGVLGGACSVLVFLSSESMFRWSLSNRFFGSAMFDYYANGKTIPRHAKAGVIGLISFMTISSATFVWYVSTLGEGEYFNLVLGMGQIWIWLSDHYSGWPDWCLVALEESACSTVNQCKNRRWPVKIIAMPCSSAASMDS